VFLDTETRSAIAHGSPTKLRDTNTDPRIAAFMLPGHTPPSSAHEALSR
jgi:hypothetical protein